MKPLSKGKLAVIITSSVLGAVFLYALICCAITFIPMIHMAVVNVEACGEWAEPTETIALENGVSLYAFPQGNVRDKYVIVCPGGGYVGCAVETEGFAVATEFNRLGYPAFVLQYRTGEAITTPKAPLDDLANAIRYVDEHASEYDVAKGHYVLCGFSAGGNLIGLFGTQAYGYAAYEGIDAPEALLMGYPWCNPTAATFNGNIADYAYYASLSGNGAKAFLHSTACYDDMQVPLWIDEHYPRTYIMHGDSDKIAPAEMHSEVLAQALEAQGIDYRYEVCEGVMHGCGIGLGTAAEGWIEDAMRFAYSK